MFSEWAKRVKAYKIKRLERHDDSTSNGLDKRNEFAHFDFMNKSLVLVNESRKIRGLTEVEDFCIGSIHLSSQHPIKKTLACKRVNDKKAFFETTQEAEKVSLVWYGEDFESYLNREENSVFFPMVLRKLHLAIEEGLLPEYVKNSAFHKPDKSINVII